MAKKMAVVVERKNGYAEIRAEKLSARVEKGVKVTAVTVRYLNRPRRTKSAVLFGSVDVTLNEVLTLYGVRIVRAEVNGKAKTFLAPMSRRGTKGRMHAARIEDPLQEKILEQVRELVRAYQHQLKAEREVAAAKA